ncbi:hypothetical protein Hs30E_01650 [Lactococcus hodotermopsidis]|uniref:Uncharacterized protein n=1 Tax=Pseudolactococcus hodotermopsidis TaxID=2709157 RepID=A0A6A0BB76_9LACT|nr:hypothetical protein [Lactococcus hodotermopsidis]GFH41614.1 hypothetical protein Hs30E_01650 [Lactococcus hodotermopsidis]
MSSIIYIGMDVHKKSFNLCALDGRTGELLAETRCNSEVKDVKNLSITSLKKWQMTFL